MATTTTTEPVVTLQKPLGSDIYDVEVFNGNFRLIEQYLNRFVTLTNIGLKVFYYPESSSKFDIDAAPTGIHVCDRLAEDNLLGTYPTAKKTYFQVLTVDDNNTDKSRSQLYFDMSNPEKTALYFRCKTSERGASAVWSNWRIVGGSNQDPDGDAGAGSGGVKVGLFVSYPDSINIDATSSGVYICQDLGTNNVQGLPKELATCKNFQLVCYGEQDNKSIVTQVITNLDYDNKLISYSRYKHKDGDGNWQWSEWVQGYGSNISGSGGGGSGDIDTTSYKIVYDDGTEDPPLPDDALGTQFAIVLVNSDGSIVTE